MALNGAYYFFSWFWAGLEVWDPGNIGKRSILISFELRNTGTRTISTQFWTETYGNTNQFDSVLNWEILEHEPVWSLVIHDGQPGRTGSGDWKAWGKNPFWEYVSRKKLNIIYHWILTLLYFYKKGARRKMMKFGGGFAARSLIGDRFRPEN